MKVLWKYYLQHPQEIVGHCDLLIIHCGLIIGNEITTKLEPNS